MPRGDVPLEIRPTPFPGRLQKKSGIQGHRMPQEDTPSLSFLVSWLSPDEVMASTRGGSAKASGSDSAPASPLIFL